MVLWRGLGWAGLGGKISRKAQERTPHVYGDGVVLARDERTRSMKLPLDLYGTQDQAGIGAWVLLEAVIAPPRNSPVVDPTPSAMSRSPRLLSLNVRHVDTVP